MKKVLMIVLNDFVNDSRVLKEASSLGKFGYTVKVLALHNSGLSLLEDFNYFHVERINLKTRRRLGKNKYIQIIKFAEFYIKCIIKGLRFSPDVIHCHDVDTLPIGSVLKTLLLGHKTKLIYDSHELWSDKAYGSSMPAPIFKVLNIIEKLVIRNCDKVITVSDSISKHLKELYKLGDNPAVIRNIPFFTHITNKSDVFRSKFQISKEKKIILYQGVISDGRGISAIIEVMKYLSKDIVLVILGYGDLLNNIKEKVSNLGLSERVFFHNAVKPGELLSYTCAADLGISLIENCNLSYFYSLPNKIFEYIQAEIPLICSNFPDMSSVVKTYQVGEVADPEDLESIIAAIQKIFNNNKYYQYKLCCRNAKEVLNWEMEEKALLGIYKDLLQSI